MLYANGKAYAEWFHHEEPIELQLNRYRFVYADRPSEGRTWEAIQREYRAIQAKREGANV